MVVLMLSVMLVWIRRNVGVGVQLEMNGLRNLEGGREGGGVAWGAGNYGRRGEIVNWIRLLNATQWIPSQLGRSAQCLAFKLNSAFWSHKCVVWSICFSFLFYSLTLWLRKHFTNILPSSSSWQYRLTNVINFLDPSPPRHHIITGHMAILINDG